jgi:hypothetical protein
MVAAIFWFETFDCPFTLLSMAWLVNWSLFQDSISLSFECPDVTMLLYEFWLYGVPKDAPRLSEYYDSVQNHNNMCEMKNEYGDTF